MGAKTKAVVNAGSAQLAEVEKLVSRGEYKSVSDFMRQAVQEKLEKIAEARLAEQVAQYAAAGHCEEDADLVAWQAWPGTRPRRRAAPRQRAKR